MTAESGERLIRPRVPALAARLALAACVATLALAGPSATRADGQQPADASLVEVLVTYQEYDSFLPWQKHEPGLRRGYGVFVSPSRVITTENLVRNHQLVELRRPRTGEKIGARVEMSDDQVNLASLSVRPSRLTDGVAPIPLADSVNRTGQVTILQFDETSQIQRGDARVYEVSIAALPRAPHSTLSFSLLTDFNVNAEGAPVTQNGKLAGLMMSYSSNTRTGNMLPYCLIRRFLDGVNTPPYPGFASAGFLWNDLVDPVKRRFLQVAESSGGVQVLSLLAGSGASRALKPNDVILKLDGRDIDNLGYYRDAEFGRLGFSYLIMGYRRPGDEVPVEVMRDGKVITVHVQLSRPSDDALLVPENVAGDKAEYLVDGGLVLRELDVPYLHAHGNEWQQRVDSRLVHAFLTRRYTPSEPGERVVILAGALPDPANVGYQRHRDEIVTHVNGKPVRNMRDVFRIVDADGNLQRLKLQSVGVELVLDPSTLADANARLAKLYRIPAMRYQRPTQL